MGLVSKAASCIPCNGGMKEEWFTSHDGQKEDDFNLMTNIGKDKLTSSFFNFLVLKGSKK